MARAGSQLQLVRPLRKGEATRTYIWGLARLRPDMAGRMHGGGLSKEVRSAEICVRTFEEKSDECIELEAFMKLKRAARTPRFYDTV